jgi:hypothetical protein
MLRTEMRNPSARTGVAVQKPPLISIVDDDRSFRDSMHRLV